jgi:hypothetical protein
MRLIELAQMLGTELTIGKTVYGGKWASLDGVEIMNNGFLHGAVGFGQTLKEARQALVIAVRGKRVVTNAGGPNRCETEVPMTLKAY